MTNHADVYDVTDEAVILRVHAQPGAGRSSIVGRHGDALRVRVAAPPVEGRANAALVELLARTFGLKEAQVTLTSGESSRTKRFRLEGVSADVVDAALDEALRAGSGGRGAAGRR